MSGIEDNELDSPQSVIPHQYEEEAPFPFAFARLFDGIKAAENVGGLCIGAICTSSNHHYFTSGLSMGWGPLEGTNEQREWDQRSGMTHFGYNIVAPRFSGIGVVGAIVLDAGVGYVYSPLKHDDPEAWRFKKATERNDFGSILKGFQQRVDEQAGVPSRSSDLSAINPRRRDLTSSELNEIRAYALLAEMPTQVASDERGLCLHCGTKDEPFRRIHLPLDSLPEEDPTIFLKEAIDRMNNYVAHRLETWMFPQTTSSFWL